GYGIAAQALTAVIRAHDGRGPPTALTSAILQKLRLSSPDEVIGWTYADPSWARIAALVPVVKACAEAGDQVTQNVLLNAVQELASSVKAIVRRLGLSGTDGLESFPLVMVGGVLETDEGWDISKDVVNCISKEFPGVHPIQPKVSSQGVRDPEKLSKYALTSRMPRLAPACFAFSFPLFFFAFRSSVMKPPPCLGGGPVTAAQAGRRSYNHRPAQSSGPSCVF
ncbi:hypothetical protein KI387_032356, partial [Taxus chinensis]